jgi:hypothetical protein
MKFWEFVSLFSDEMETLESVLTEKRWSDFQDMLYDYDFLLQTSQKDVLDKLVPDALVLKAAAKSKKLYNFDDKANTLSRAIEAESKGESLSMTEVVEKYGSYFLVEIEEKGSFKLPAL